MTTLIILVLLLGALGIGGWLVRGYLTGQGAGAAILGSSRDKRIGVVDQTAVDGRRKLVLIRRDGTEHLIMTGGPVDVVIETGIPAQPRAASYERVAQLDAGAADRPSPGFGRVRQPSVAQAQSAAPLREPQ